MKLAVASGKGGTGKTTVAVSLALSYSGSEGEITFLDCDVEAPNSHIFLEPEIDTKTDIFLPVPEIHEERCTFCGQCRDICRFNAITMFGNTIMSFPDMCHSCGGCFRVCDASAISRQQRLVGTLLQGRADSSRAIRFVAGRLRVGEAMAVPLIDAVKKAGSKSRGLVILDAPPGTSCPVVATVKDADYCLLVTEPTPFGLHDLKIAVDVMRKLERPFGVVLNRAGMGYNGVEQWCNSEGVPIMLTIPFSKDIASGYAAGMPLVKQSNEMSMAFSDFLHEIVMKYGGDT